MMKPLEVKKEIALKSKDRLLQEIKQSRQAREMMILTFFKKEAEYSEKTIG